MLYLFTSRVNPSCSEISYVTPAPSREGGCNLFLETDSGSLKYVSTLQEEGGVRLHALAVGGGPGRVTVLGAGQEVTLWQQGAGGEVRARSLALLQGLDSGSEGEESEEEGEVEEEEGGAGDGGAPYDQKTSGFCNCTVM